jgi:hypothetical protein
MVGMAFIRGFHKIDSIMITLPPFTVPCGLSWHFVISRNSHQEIEQKVSVDRGEKGSAKERLRDLIVIPPSRDLSKIYPLEL